MALTPRLKLPVPDLTQVADGPDAISDLALALEDWALDRILPTGITHAPVHHWGSLNSGAPTFAQGAKVGDTYYNTDLRCTMRCISDGTWAQSDGPVYCATLANRPASNSYHIYNGFQIYVNSQSQVYTWDGTYWRNGAAGDAIPTGTPTGGVITGRSGSSTFTLAGGGRANINIGTAFAANTFIVMGVPGSTGGTLGFCVADPASHTTSVASFLCYTIAGALVATGQVVRINWTVVGYNN